MCAYISVCTYTVRYNLTLEFRMKQRLNVLIILGSVLGACGAPDAPSVDQSAQNLCAPGCFEVNDDCVCPEPVSVEDLGKVFSGEQSITLAVSIQQEPESSEVNLHNVVCEAPQVYTYAGTGAHQVPNQWAYPIYLPWMGMGVRNDYQNFLCTPQTTSSTPPPTRTLGNNPPFNGVPCSSTQFTDALARAQQDPSKTNVVLSECYVETGFLPQGAELPPGCAAQRGQGRIYAQTNTIHSSFRYTDNVPADLDQVIATGKCQEEKVHGEPPTCNCSCTSPGTTSPWSLSCTCNATYTYDYSRLVISSQHPAQTACNADGWCAQDTQLSCVCAANAPNGSDPTSYYACP